MSGIEDTFLPIVINSDESVFKRFRSVKEYTYTEQESGLSAKREIVSARDAVAVVVYDPKVEKLVMIRQFRLGAQLGTGRGMSVEFVAGMIDDNEEPAETAKREMFEETGLTAANVKPLCQFLTTPGLTDEVLHLFYAETDSSNLIAEAGLENESEQTFPFLLTLDEALAAVDKNAIFNGIVMIGLMWFSRHKERLVGDQT